MMEKVTAYPEPGAVRTIQEWCAHYLGELLIGSGGVCAAIRDLSLDEYHYRPTSGENSIAWNAWHVLRTVDNIIHFAFDREQPLWIVQGLDERYGLPRTSNGTGMDPEEAHALRFPEPQRMVEYGRDLAAVVIPRVLAMSDGYLAEVVTVRPQGEITRFVSIGTNMIEHGNRHLGMMNSARAQLGKATLDF